MFDHDDYELHEAQREPNAYMPRKLKCCPPEGYLHADRLTPEEWGGWWELVTPNAEITGRASGPG